MHETQQSRSLLSQAGTSFNWRFADSAFPFSEQNMMSHHGLAAIELSSTPPTARAKFVPKCEMNEELHPVVPFSAWWNAVVFKDKRGNTFSRREVVLTLANQDGGAHVDPELDEDYAGLSKENTLGWNLKAGEQDVPWPSNPVPASVRQIAHEILVTLEAAELVDRESA